MRLKLYQLRILKRIQRAKTSEQKMQPAPADLPQCDTRVLCSDANPKKSQQSKLRRGEGAYLCLERHAGGLGSISLACVLF